MAEFNFGNLNPILTNQYQKYLPNVFDESLTLYEQIKNIEAYLNDVIEGYNSMSTSMAADMSIMSSAVSAALAEVVGFKEMIENDVIPTNIGLLLEQWLTDGRFGDIFTNDLLKTKVSTSDIVNTKISRFIGHRGCDYAPENTMASFNMAKKMGFKAVESDVLVTLDGQFVIMHDDSVDRMTNGTGNVADLTLNQIKALNIDAGTNLTSLPTQKVPTLEELLIWTNANDMGLSLEFKTTFVADDVLKIYNLLKRYNMVDKTIITSFMIEALTPVRALDATIRLCVGIDGTDIDIAMVNWLKTNLKSHCGLAPRISNLTKTGVDVAHENGVFVHAWDILWNVHAKLAIETLCVDYIATGAITEGLYYGTI